MLANKSRSSGMQRRGGILWQDAYSESYVIPNFKQVFGHTPTMGKIDVMMDDDIKGGININVDCGLMQVLEIDENGKFGTLDTGVSNFYLIYKEKQAKKFKDSVDKLISYDTF